MTGQQAIKFPGRLYRFLVLKYQYWYFKNLDVSFIPRHGYILNLFVIRGLTTQITQLVGQHLSNLEGGLQLRGEEAIVTGSWISIKHCLLIFRGCRYSIERSPHKLRNRMVMLTNMQSVDRMTFGRLTTGELGNAFLNFPPNIRFDCQDRRIDERQTCTPNDSSSLPSLQLTVTYLI